MEEVVVVVEKEGGGGGGGEEGCGGLARGEIAISPALREEEARGGEAGRRLAHALAARCPPLRRLRHPLLTPLQPRA